MNSTKQLVGIAVLSVLVLFGAGVGTGGFSDGGEPALNVTAGGQADEERPSSPTTTRSDLSRQEPTDQARAVERPQNVTTSPENEEPTETEPTSAERTQPSTATDRPTTDAGPEPTTTPDSSKTGIDSGGGVDLRTAEGGLAIQAAGVLPGDSGVDGLPVRNVGNGSGQLAVTDIRIEDHENSLVEPERAAGDDTATGELSSALRVRLVVDYGDGGSEFLAGTADEYVALEELEGAELTGEEALASGAEATVHLDWKLPLSTGNEVQTDSVDVHADLRLEGRR